MPMFESIQPAPPIRSLASPRRFAPIRIRKKINLSVGVYQDASGKTPVLESIQRAAKKVRRAAGVEVVSADSRLARVRGGRAEADVRRRITRRSRPAASPRATRRAAPARCGWRPT